MTGLGEVHPPDKAMGGSANSLRIKSISFCKIPTSRAQQSVPRRQVVTVQLGRLFTAQSRDAGGFIHTTTPNNREGAATWHMP